MEKYFILLATVIIVSCKQYYEPGIDTEASIVNIQGLLTNENGNVSVTISKAIPFDTVSSFVNDGNSSVTIVDDAGKVYVLNNNGSGVYSNNNLAGEIGHAYTLHVITQSGDEFVSSPETMPGDFTLDSIYGQHIKKAVVNETTNGDFIINVSGVEFFTDLGSSSGELPRCRFESLVTYLYWYFIYWGTPRLTTVYGWSSFNPNREPNVTSDRFSKTQNVVKEHNLCFFVDTHTVHPDSVDVSVLGWLFTLTKYNLNSKSQAYYQNIANQLEASDKLFAPVPSQLPSNISCINNPDKKIIGFFEVSSVERKYYHCFLDKNIQFVEKDNFPGFSNEGEVLSVEPSFFLY
jgi:hypothetical protein